MNVKKVRKRSTFKNSLGKWIRVCWRATAVTTSPTKLNWLMPLINTGTNLRAILLTATPQLLGSSSLSFTVLVLIQHRSKAACPVELSSVDSGAFTTSIGSPSCAAVAFTPGLAVLSPVPSCSALLTSAWSAASTFTTLGWPKIFRTLEVQRSAWPPVNFEICYSARTQTKS